MLTSLLSPLCVSPFLRQANASEKKRSTTAVTTVQLYKQIMMALYVRRPHDTDDSEETTRW